MNQSEYETLMMAHDNLQRELSDIKRLMGKDKHALIKSNIALSKRVQELERQNKRYREALEEIMKIQENHEWNLYGLAYAIAERTLFELEGEE